MARFRRAWLAAVVGACLVPIAAAHAEDWPGWRGDGGRTAETPEKLPEPLELRWVRRLPPLEPAWPDDSRLQFDAGYQPVLVGDLALLASSGDDSLTALDAATGQERWKFRADGPVRFAPYCWKGRAYLVSDDGWLYCVGLADGRLLWKYPGAPDARRRTIGNGRLISVWPARGAPVVADRTVYFAAGIWPFMGVFVHALDAETGAQVWTNSGSGSIFMPQPHRSPAFGGLAPQGYLAVNGDRLLVPNGRAVAAGLRRSNGQLLYFRLGENGGNGNFFVATRGPVFFNSYSRFLLSDGANQGLHLSRPVLSDRVIYDSEPTPEPKPGDPPRPPKAPRWQLRQAGPVKQFCLAGDEAPRIMLKADSRLYAVAGGKLLALKLPRANGEVPAVTWQADLPGPACAVVAAHGRLMAATTEGEIRCFAAPEPGAKVREHQAPAAAKVEIGQGVAKALAAAGTTGGYALVLGARSAGLPAGLAAGGQLRVIALAGTDGDLAGIREALDRAGLYGARAAALRGDVFSAGLPLYMASLVVVDDPEAAGWGRGTEFVREVFRVLRPYGGTLVLPEDHAGRLEVLVREAGLEGAEVRRSEGCVLLVRRRPPPGSGQWTHQYAGPANTVASEERGVQAPLGVLWFGGPSNKNILPRHGHGPIPQVAGGRLVIEGPDLLRALDVYTGRLLWEAELPGVGRFYDILQHQPGANATGSNYVTLPDAVYVIHQGKCLRLDPATGRKAAEFTLPPESPGGPAPDWSWLAVYGSVLLAGAAPQEFYDPDFSPEELMRHIRETEALDRIAKWLPGIRGFKLRPKAEGERTSAHLGRNLNLLLRQRDLAGRLPGTPPENAGAIITRVEVLLKSRPDLPADDTKLRELNRALLAAYNPDIPGKEPLPPGARMTWNGMSSRRLLALDRDTGRVLWQVSARQAFVHNAIAAGGGKVFCVDRFPEQVLRWRQFNGFENGPARLTALEAGTGRVVWSLEGHEAFAPWLAYSEEHDLLLQAARPSRDHLPEYEKRMAAHRGSDGKLVWSRELEYRGPPVMVGDRLYTQEGALELLTGRSVEFACPLTGEQCEWRWSRQYGCGSVLGCRSMLTFRSGTAGYWDLSGWGGVGNLGGFKPGCTNNMIPADGVLAVPDYTRTCKCSFPTQWSLGLVHDPAAEVWTYQGYAWSGAPVRRVGLNFGAPGDRLAADGTLWLDWPSVGHASPDLPVECAPLAPAPRDVLPTFPPPVKAEGEPPPPPPPPPAPLPETFRMHSSEIGGEGLRWVAASGLRNVEKLAVDLGKGAERRYTVRLHFCEPERLRPGARVFDVWLQGRRVLAGLDVAAGAGGERRALVKEFKGIVVRERLELVFKPGRGSAGAVLSGLEAVLEE